MKITAIELTENELKSVVNYLISKFNTEDKKQTIEFDLYDLDMPSEYELYSTICIESTLELYTEYPEVDENNQIAISYRSVSKFDITFFYDGEEIKVNSDKIYELIDKYYEI